MATKPTYEDFLRAATERRLAYEQAQTPPVQQDQGFFGDMVDMAQRGAAQTLGGDLETVGQLTNSQGIKDMGRGVSAWGEGQLQQVSTPMREAMGKQFFQENKDTGAIEAGDAWGDWRAWAGQGATVIGQIGAMVAGTKGAGLLARPVARGAATAFAKDLVEGKAKELVAKQTVKEAIQNGALDTVRAAYSAAPTEAAKRAVLDQAIGRLGAIGYGAHAGAMASGMRAQQAEQETREHLNSLDNDKLNATPTYQQAYWELADGEMQGAHPAEIRRAAIDSLAEKAATQAWSDPKALAADFASGYLTGAVGGVGGALERIGTTRAGAAVRGFVSEGATEAWQGGETQRAVNEAVKEWGDETRDPMAGVLSAALNEGIIGGVAGGSIAGIAGPEAPAPTKTKVIVPRREVTGNAKMDDAIHQFDQRQADRGAALDDEISAMFSGSQNPLGSSKFDPISDIPAYQRQADSPITAIPVGEQSSPEIDVTQGQPSVSQQEAPESEPALIDNQINQAAAEQSQSPLGPSTGQFDPLRDKPAYLRQGNAEQLQAMGVRGEMPDVAEQTAAMPDQQQATPDPLSSTVGQLQSLRITRAGKPFATEKEAAHASRPGQEMPVPLNGGGFGVAQIAEVQQVQAQEPAANTDSTTNNTPADQPVADVSAETVTAPVQAEASQQPVEVTSNEQTTAVDSVSSEQQGDQPVAGEPVLPVAEPGAGDGAGLPAADNASGAAPDAASMEPQQDDQALTTPATDAGVVVSGANESSTTQATMPWREVVDNPDGTITLKGDLPAIKAWAKGEGVKAVPGKGGLVVAKPSVAKVRDYEAPSASDPVKRIEEARAEVAPKPTEAQKEAGNYKKGHLTLHGLDIALENPKGSTRSGTDSNGKAWQSTMAHDYGYIKGTTGADGDHVDVFIGDQPDSEMVYVVDQVDPKTGKFDEHKVMMGFADEQAARDGYLANYEKGWSGLGAIKAMSMDEFKRWVSDGDATKPVTDAASVQDSENGIERSIAFSKQSQTEGSIPAKHLTRKEAELVTKEWLKQYRGASGIDVRIHANQAEMETALGLEHKDGLIRRAAFDDDNGTLHVAADTIANPKRMREILRHEVLAHYGLANVLGGGEYTNLMSRIIASKDDPSMRDVWQWVETHYADESTGVQAEEVVAHLAELEPSAWRRGWEKVVNWLTKALRAVGFLPSSHVSATEIRALIETLGNNLQGGYHAEHQDKDGARFSQGKSMSQESTPNDRDIRLPKSFVITEDEAISHGYDPEDIYYSGTNGDLSSGIQRGHSGPHNNLFDGIFASGNERSASSHGDKVQRFIVKNQDVASGRDLDTDESRAYLDRELKEKGLSEDDFETIYDAVVFDNEIAFSGEHDKLLSRVTGMQDPAEQSWEMQRLRGQVARANGYDVVAMDDEHGTSYLLVGDGVRRLAEPGENLDTKAGIRFSQTATDSAMDKLSLGVKPDIIDRTKERLEALRGTDKSTVKKWVDRFIKKANTEMLDALAPIKYAEDAAGVTEAGDSGYVAARLASGSAATMQATMLYGLPEWKDGVIQRKAGTGESDALLGIFEGLGKDLHNWLGWMAGHRAEILMTEGRENLLTADEITALKALDKGKEAQFQEAKQKWNAVNRAVLDLAEEAGLFTKADRANWESEWYIPFFRESEDGDAVAPFKAKGLANQSAGIKKLKGGTEHTADLLENIFSSTGKLIDASMKNMAAQKIVWNLADTDLIEVVAKPNMMDWRAIKNGRELITVKLEGEDYMLRVNDHDLYRAMTFFDRKPFGKAVQLASKAKRLLTAGVTASPEFMFRNFMRDSLSAWAISKDGFKPVVDSIKGIRKALAMDGSTLDVMFSGASFLGGYVNGNDPGAMADSVRKALRRKGMTPEQISKYEKSIIRNAKQAQEVIAGAWDKYAKYGEAFENANREAVYDAAIKAGKSHAQAAFEAKDLMDFSMLGASRSMQLFVQLLPFFNARVQGLGKLGRELRDNPRAIARRAGMITAASLALLAMNWDDDRYNDLPDWDKDANWHFFLGDQHFRIPKPFEIGVMFATIPERMVRVAGGADTGEQFGKALARSFMDTFALNPTPQVVKPLVESYFNYDTFRGAPIENMSDLAVRAEARYNENTSLLMREIGQATSMSPKKLEHLMIGYTGTIGSYVMAAADGLIRAMSPGESAAWRADEIPVVKAFYRGSAPAKSTQQMDQFYSMLDEVNKLKRTVDQYRKEGMTDEAKALLDEQGGILRARSNMSRTQQQIRQLRNEMELIQRDRILTADQKRERLDKLMSKRNALVAESVKRNQPLWE